MNAVRRWSFCLWLVALAISGAACDKAGRARCTAEQDAAACAQGQECLWIHAGAGFFCGTVCGAATPCASNQTCKTGAASSCATCQDVVDVCE